MQDLAKKKINIKSPAKINLHLEVIGKRKDGFHELAMIMQNIDLSDYLEFQINNEGLIKLDTDTFGFFKRITPYSRFESNFSKISPLPKHN